MHKDGTLCEYRAIPADDPRVETTSRCRGIDEAHLADYGREREWEIYSTTAGWAPAGSVARWQEPRWGVRTRLDGASHGQYWTGPDAEAKARAAFAALTSIHSF